MYESVKFQKVDKYSTVSRVGCEHCIHSKNYLKYYPEIMQLTKENNSYTFRKVVKFSLQ